MVILSRNFALLFLNLLCMVCSTRVHKWNPTNAHANIKLIYRGYVSVSFDENLLKDSFEPRNSFIKALRKLKAPRCSDLFIYYFGGSTLLFYRASFAILDRKKRTYNFPIEFLIFKLFSSLFVLQLSFLCLYRLSIKKLFVLTAGRSVKLEEIMRYTGLQTTTINRNDCSKFNS